ncbi:MAG: hypothetical protein DRI37_07890 [Chloroflexi bacterium]|nr:MAG: hypothetical protein DRI37_07890 [Chloroflexota bacterium]
MLLTPEETELYYKLPWAVLAYANRHLNLIPDVATPDNMSSLSTPEKFKVRTALYEEHPDVSSQYLGATRAGPFADSGQAS